MLKAANTFRLLSQKAFMPVEITYVSSYGFIFWNFIDLCVCFTEVLISLGKMLLPLTQWTSLITNWIFLWGTSSANVYTIEKVNSVLVLLCKGFWPQCPERPWAWWAMGGPQATLWGLLRWVDGLSQPYPFPLTNGATLASPGCSFLICQMQVWKLNSDLTKASWKCEIICEAWKVVAAMTIVQAIVRHWQS